MYKLKHIKNNILNIEKIIIQKKKLNIKKIKKKIEKMSDKLYIIAFFTLIITVNYHFK